MQRSTQSVPNPAGSAAPKVCGPIELRLAEERERESCATPLVIGPDRGASAPPLVDGVRRYVFCVTETNSGDTIFADNVTDVMGCLLGAGYRETVAESLVAAQSQHTDPRAYILLEYELARMRAVYADGIRIETQCQINAAAMADGSWKELTALEKSALTKAASVDSGQPTEPGGAAGSEDRGPDTPLPRVWTSPVALAVNTGDFHPWATTPFPYAGRHSGNIVEIIVDTENDYLLSLQAVGKLSIYCH